MSHIHSTFLWLALLCLLEGFHGRYTISSKYLNKKSDCGGKNIFNVTNAHVYKIRADEIPGNTSFFIECTMTFKGDADELASKERVCLDREILGITVHASGVELTAKDITTKGDITIFTLGQGDFWQNPEYCAKPNSKFVKLSFKLSGTFNSERARADAAKAVDVKKNSVNLKVLLMSSRKRRFYMSSTHCEGSFSLDHSDVSVYNRQRPEDLKGVQVFEPKTRCQITFKRESSKNRSICMVYIPQGSRDCSSEWKLLVIRERNSLSPSNYLNQLVCKSDPMVTSAHAWCAPYELDEVTLLHWRSSQVTIWSNQTDIERPEMYRLVITDFSSNDTQAVLDYTQKWLAQEAEEEKRDDEDDDNDDIDNKNNDHA